MTRVLGELNENLQFHQLPLDHQKSFRMAPKPKLIRFNRDHSFYKWTQYSLVQPKGDITPFWSTYQDIPEYKVSGFNRLKNRYESQPGNKPSFADWARARCAVSQKQDPAKHNTMSGLLVIKLRVPAWAFLGIVQAQPMWVASENQNASKEEIARAREEDNRVMYIGGEWQVYIPNLTLNSCHQLPTMV